MTLEDDLKNIKGRIREAVYEGKSISIFNNFHSFYRFCTGEQCTSTHYFLSYVSTSRLFVFCRPNSASEQIVNELRRYIQRNGGNPYDF